jgi:hypothetical protein
MTAIARTGSQGTQPCVTRLGILTAAVEADRTRASWDEVADDPVLAHWGQWDFARWMGLCSRRADSILDGGVGGPEPMTHR